MSLLHWRSKISPTLLKVIEGSPEEVPVLIKVIPEVMVSLESVLVQKYKIKVVRRIPTAGYISAIVKEEYVAEIAKMPQVISITHIPKVGLMPVVPTLPYLEAKVAEAPTTLTEISSFLGIAPLKERGFTGKGVLIAVIDSGVEPTHPFLLGKIAKEKYFAGTSPRDSLGHGSHVSGIAVGNPVETSYGVMEGLSPDARIINVKIFDKAETTADICMQGLEYAAMNGSSIINCSWGSTEHFPPFHDLIKVLKNRYGCVFVTAAGNEGQPNSIVCPADSPDVVAVGSVSAKTGQVSSFSSRGPVDSLIKPDLMGVGESVVSSYLNSTYKTLSGTSMSTPCVSGGLACLFQGGRLNLNSVYSQASKHGVKDNTLGYGIPNFALSQGEAVRAGLPLNLLINLGILPFGFVVTKWAK